MSDVNSEKTARVFTNADEDEVPEPDHEDPHAFTRAGLIPKWRVTWFDDDKDSWDFLDYDNADAQQAANLAMAIGGIVHRFYSPGTLGAGEGAIEPDYVWLALGETQVLDALRRERERKEKGADRGGWTYARSSTLPPRSSKPPATGWVKGDDGRG